MSVFCGFSAGFSVSIYEYVNKRDPIIQEEMFFNEEVLVNLLEKIYTVFSFIFIAFIALSADFH